MADGADGTRRALYRARRERLSGGAARDEIRFAVIQLPIGISNIQRDAPRLIRSLFKLLAETQPQTLQYRRRGG